MESKCSIILRINEQKTNYRLDCETPNFATSSSSLLDRNYKTESSEKLQKPQAKIWQPVENAHLKVLPYAKFVVRHLIWSAVASQFFFFWCSLEEKIRTSMTQIKVEAGLIGIYKIRLMVRRGSEDVKFFKT